jgi:DNA-binding NarL/FixJ family response regulator
MQKISLLPALVTFVMPSWRKNRGILRTSVDAFKMKLRILIADDNQKALLALVAALSQDFNVIATATDGQSALEQIRQLQPSVAVLDLNMPELNGIEVTREIARQSLSCAVVICSVAKAPELIEAALAAGALGYVFKRRLIQDLSIAVKRAADGESFISAS